MKRWADDPIAALASSEGAGGVAVLRLSGAGCWNALASIVPDGIPAFAPRETVSIDIEWEAGEALVPGLVLPFPPGGSYTTEESVEIILPGCPPLLRRVLERLRQAGVRPATPGEFTRRAFLGGRFDLASAEAVAEVIAAEDCATAAAVRKTLEGELAREVRTIAERIHDLVARLEAGLDFAEQEVEPPQAAGLAADIDSRGTAVTRLLDAGLAHVREGPRIRFLIGGLANAGKSTLFNRLTGGERAITSARAGTTRDPVSYVFEKDGLPWFELVDLAGRRGARAQDEGRPADEVEGRAVDLGEALARDADTILYVFDGTRPPREIGAEWTDLAPDVRARAWPIINKGDLVHGGPSFGIPDAMLLSARTSDGVGALWRRMEARLLTGSWRSRGTGFLFTERQAGRLRECRDALRRARVLAGEGSPEELIVVDLRDALERLEELTGVISTEATLDKVFGQFCLGK